MRHRVKKTRLKSGTDANHMLARQLLVNFFTRGKLVTTKSKAQKLKPLIEKIVEKAKIENEPNKNYLLKKVNSTEIIKKLFKEIGPAIIKKNGGYIRLVGLEDRLSDGALRTRIEWVYPVVTIQPEAKEVKAKPTRKI